ncbi:DUF5680 domain-containing protein [Halosimplex amylolyticum]|uniref:DUF5680 domain-containing protein n=1 Tax=Halosimplex amylolyticum TaxID=3396616 RepID=UPI003F547220
MDSSDLRAFVAEAHANGYATAEGIETDDERTVIEYERGDWRYVDRYVGGREFLGAEVVNYRGDPVWGMHYDGYLTADDVGADEVYDFLRDVLERVSESDPFRGPDFERGEFAYECRANGDLGRFDGSEAIRLAGRTVYEGRFAGGRVE